MGWCPEINKNIKEAGGRLSSLDRYYLIIGGLAEQPFSCILMGRYPKINKIIREAGGCVCILTLLTLTSLSEGL
jgi:hypothetical protein